MSDTTGYVIHVSSWVVTAFTWAMLGSALLFIALFVSALLGKLVGDSKGPGDV